MFVTISRFVGWLNQLKNLPRVKLNIRERESETDIKIERESDIVVIRQTGWGPTLHDTK